MQVLGPMRFRTVRPTPCVSVYLFLRFRKIVNFIFAFLWHFLIDASRFRNTATQIALFVFCVLVNLQVNIGLHWRIFVVELQIQLVNTSLWMNVPLVNLWIFIPLKLATVRSTILTTIHLSVTRVTVQDQLTHQSGRVTEVVPAASVKRFSSIHKAQSLLYVVFRETETSSESDSRASMLRLSVLWIFYSIFDTYK